MTCIFIPQGVCTVNETLKLISVEEVCIIVKCRILAMLLGENKRSEATELEFTRELPNDHLKSRRQQLRSRIATVITERLAPPIIYTFYMFYMDNTSPLAAKMVAFPVRGQLDERALLWYRAR